MKKQILIGVVGLVTCAATSFGQGFVILDNYNATGGLVTYGPNVPQNGVSGPLGTLGTGLLSGWTVGLYYVLGTPAISDPPFTTDPVAPLALATGGPTSGATVAVYDSSFSTPGQFASPYNFQVPGGVAGQLVTLELIVYDTADGSWASAHYRGHSAPFVLTMQTGTAIPPTAQVGPAFSAFGVEQVPEPATLALAGLGGLSLLLMRRKLS